MRCRLTGGAGALTPFRARIASSLREGQRVGESEGRVRSAGAADAALHSRSQDAGPRPPNSAHLGTSGRNEEASPC